MNGFLQSIFPFQGLSSLGAQGLTEFTNSRTGSLWGHVSNLPKKPQVENLAAQGSWYVSWKPGVEFVLALVGLILTVPLILIAATLIKLTSRGPAIYTQVRLGNNGRRFTIYKLRTMYDRAEATTGPVWAAPGDQRVIPFGKLLRATHLDELPQLVNVLMGDMSLIGPRPERPEIVHQLQARVENYLQRLTVRPGITGLAQVQLPPDVDLDGVRKKLICDLHYIERFGFWLDFRLLLCTALLFLGVPLRWSRWLLQIPQPLDDASAFCLSRQFNRYLQSEKDRIISRRIIDRMALKKQHLSVQETVGRSTRAGGLAILFPPRLGGQVPAG
jgi:lipopolysaccharide/colanic/teichoic acid biosynthesis glycosyltransferase